MKRLMCAVVLALGLFVAFANGQEQQVPFDSSGKIERIDQQLEQELQLFSEYPGFREATLYQTTDTTYALEIVYTDSARVMRTRRPLTDTEVIELRHMVMQAIYEQAPAAILDRSGRKALIAGNLTIAILYHGWALPATLKVNNATAAGGMYLITAAAGYFVPMLMTEHSNISRGTATLAMYGASRGIGHGLMLGLVLEGDSITNAILGMGMGISILEEILAVQIASQTKMSDGDAVAIGVLGDFGAAIGVGMAHVTRSFDGYHARTVGGWVLAGSAAGLTAGGILSPKIDYTRGDAYIVRGAGVLGAMIPITCVDYASPDNNYVYTYAAMAGSVAGVIGGHVLIQDRDFSTDNGALVILGEVAGGLLGLGLVTLASPGGENSGAAYWTGATIGAAGGFALTYSLLQNDAKQEARRNLELGLDFHSASDFAVHEPIGLTKPPALPMAGLCLHF